MGEPESTRDTRKAERWISYAQSLRRPGLYYVADVKIFAENLAKLLEQREKSIANGFYIEAIQIDAYLFELFIEEWINDHTGSRPRRGDTATLGERIEQASKLGFESRLVDRLREFNRSRAAAIHGLLHGEILYGDLETGIGKQAPLMRDLLTWIHGEGSRWPGDS